MLLLGLRDQTVAVVIKLDPEPKGIFAQIPAIKDELEINIELASPADFVPPPSDWRERSRLIQQIGPLHFHHFDFRAQAISKIERGLERDVSDVRAMMHKGIISKESLLEALECSDLLKNPAIDAEVLTEKVKRFE